jgi:homocysteine S-methyltransferase
MAKYRSQLPQLDADVFLTDGGLETTLIFDDGLELPDFAAFTLYASDAGREALERYFSAYVAIAARDGVGIVLETATWRASPDWGTRLGYSTEQLVDVNRESVEHLVRIRERYETPATPIVISGCIGPRGDGYQVGAQMTVAEATEYHGLQAAAFAGTEADLVTAITMTYPDEATGIVEAARKVDMPVVISFTVETDGSLPNGQSLREGVEAVDSATDSYAAFFMINCAHPTHFQHVLDPSAGWTRRIRGIRANASKMSHAELDEAEELDAGDPAELAATYRDLRARLAQLTVLGGCCGTSDQHIDAISAACVVGTRG